MGITFVGRVSFETLRKPMRAWTGIVPHFKLLKMYTFQICEDSEDQTTCVEFTNYEKVAVYFKCVNGLCTCFGCLQWIGCCLFYRSQMNGSQLRATWRSQTLWHPQQNTHTAEVYFLVSINTKFWNIFSYSNDYREYADWPKNKSIQPVDCLDNMQSPAKSACFRSAIFGSA